MLIEDRKGVVDLLEEFFEKPMEDLAENPRAQACDNVYMDFTNCEERRFDPMFHVRYGDGLPYLQMYSHILRRDLSHGLESMKLTNWSDKRTELPKKFDQILSWKTPDSDDEDSKYYRKLWMDEKLIQRFLPRYCSVDHKCILCRDGNSNSKVKTKYPNQNQNKKGCQVITPIETTSERYKVRYETRVANFKDKSVYPKFKRTRSLKVREWRRKQKAPQAVSEIDNYVALPLKKNGVNSITNGDNDTSIESR